MATVDREDLNPTELSKPRQRPTRAAPVYTPNLGASFHAIAGVLVTAHALVESLERSKVLDPVCRLEQRLDPEDLRALEALRAAVKRHKALRG